MSSAKDATQFTIALIGNPNTGKSTVFNALAGMRQRVGNYPGVTVEKKLGRLVVGDKRLQLVDLPGTYSLAPRSPDEMVAVEVLLGRQDGAPIPDAVLCIVDASNIERNLYLVSQVLELGLPVVVALNMVDVARERGMRIDAARLSQRLGAPVVEVQANRQLGFDALRAALAEAVERRGSVPPSPFPPAFQEAVGVLSTQIEAVRHTNHHLSGMPRYLVERLLLDTSGFLATALGDGAYAGLRATLEDQRRNLTAAGCPIPAVEAMSRYRWVGDVLEGVVDRPAERPVTRSDRIDRLLTHRLWGALVFAALMLAMFQAVFSWAEWPMNRLEEAVGGLGEFVGARLEEGPLRSLLVDGVIAGVGAVVVFLPQIFILFFFLGLLEECGYMARAAYLMDKLMVRVGLSGKSFIPLLSSFACAIPGVMATRVIENRRDRLTTILVAPLMSCSARLPVYTVMIEAFVPDRRLLGGWLRLQSVTMFGMYAVGIVAAVAMAWLLKRTLLRGETPPFVMELPSYKFPSLRLWPPGVVWARVVDRCWAFLRRAGTLIFAVSVLVWAALYYPRDEDAVEGPYRARQAELAARLQNDPEDENALAAQAEIEHEIAGQYQRRSYLGQAGRWIEPAVEPLGWDWRIGSAAIASFPAREVVVGTLGVIFNLGPEVDLEEAEDRSRLEVALQNAAWQDRPDRKLFTLPVALSLMVFFALCAQCAATLAVIRRETNSYRWPLFTFGYMTGLAYLAALCVYQLGSRLF